MLNPFKRLRELTTTSQKDFAEKYEVSKTTMIYIESGQLVDLSDYMVRAISAECANKSVHMRQVLKYEYGASTLQDAYHAWQASERLLNAHRFQAKLSGQETFDESPFAVYVKDVAGSQQRFCKLLKVPSASVMRYMDGVTQTMPRAIEEALTQVSFVHLNELKGLQTKWVGVGLNGR